EARSQAHGGNARCNIPFHPSALIPLRAKRVHAINVDRHAQSACRFCAHIRVPGHAAAIGIDFLDVRIDDIHAMQEPKMHDIEYIGRKNPGLAVQLVVEHNFIGASDMLFGIEFVECLKFVAGGLAKEYPDKSELLAGGEVEK